MATPFRTETGCRFRKGISLRDCPPGCTSKTAGPDESEPTSRRSEPTLPLRSPRECCRDGGATAGDGTTDARGVAHAAAGMVDRGATLRLDPRCSRRDHDYG